MTATLGTAEPAATQSPFRAATFMDVIRSEWTKARTVPSTVWTLVVAVVLGVGLGALISAVAAHHYSQASPSVRAVWDPTSISGAGLSLAQLAIGVLGILVITSEYSTREISTSLAAVPRRSRFLAAKAAVVVGMTFLVTEITAFAAFFVGQALIAGHAPTASLGDPHVARALIGCGLYGALIVLLGLSLGTMLRSAAGAIAVLVAVMFVLPGVAAALPSSIEHTVEKYWPTQAGQQVTQVVRVTHSLPPWAGFGVFSVVVAVAISAAFLVLGRRDA
jgi:ABC-2 type transport system permease protein